MTKTHHHGPGVVVGVVCNFRNVGHTTGTEATTLGLAESNLTRKFCSVCVGMGGGERVFVSSKRGCASVNFLYHHFLPHQRYRGCVTLYGRWRLWCELFQPIGSSGGWVFLPPKSSCSWVGLGGGANQAGWRLNEGCAIVQTPGIVRFGVKLQVLK